MAKGPRTEAERLAARRKSAVFLDAEGNRTDDPALVRRGEIVDHDEHGDPVRRTSLRVLETQWPRLNASAVLLVALGLLLGLWLLVAVILL